MAVTGYGLNSPETVKLYSKDLFRESYDLFHFAGLVGTDINAPIQEKTETSKGPGDRVTVTLAGNLTQPGVAGDGQVEGNEEAITTSTDNLVIDALDFAVRVKNKGTIDRQRVPFELRDTAKDLLAEHWHERMEISLCYQGASYTATSDATAAPEPLGNDTRYTGMNSTAAATTGRILYPPGITADQNLTSAHPLTLNLIDRAVAKARQKDSNGNPRIRKAKIKGYPKPLYIMMVHTNGIYQLRADAQTAGNWNDIMMATLQGGEISENPIFTGEDSFLYNGVLVVSSNYVPRGVSGADSSAVANVRRNFFFGAQGLVLAYGENNAGGAMDWVEDTFNYQKELGIDSHLIFGMKKTKFQSKDFGTMVIPTYSPEP
jgi:N4-gp56 family major capsid protein